MPPESDVCLIVEGGYPYVLGGVASWMDALIRASSGIRFSIVSASISSQSRVPKYELPENVVGVSDVILDCCPVGRSPRSRDEARIHEGVSLIKEIIEGSSTAMQEFTALLSATGFGGAALLDSKSAWKTFEQLYERTIPNGSLIDFFWSWRFLARSVLAVCHTALPQASAFHAVSTGYAGLISAYAKVVTGKPCIVTEHGIYTNERRIELGVASWVFDSGSTGFTVGDKPVQLRDFWLDAFCSFSRISYHFADVVTAQYRANQDYQRADGAAEYKLRIIPNGIDVEFYRRIPRITEPRPPTVLMIGRIVPIKDVRTFIAAIGLLREKVSDVRAILIGPEEEDPDYAAGCHALVSQLGLEETVQFPGRVPDVTTYLARTDVFALTSISEAQPIALMEAAAMAIPAVTTDVGSCRELIEGFGDDPVVGHGGIVVDVCNPKALAEALAVILLDEQQRVCMGDIMQRRISNLYHKERVRELYERLYAEAGGWPMERRSKIISKSDLTEGESRRHNTREPLGKEIGVRFA